MFSRLGKWHTVGVVVVLALLVLVLYSASGSSDIDEGSYYELDEGWNITVADQEFLDTNVSEVFFNAPKVGETVSMTVTMPETDIDNPLIRMYSIHSTVEVLLDGEEIYEYGHKLNSENKMLGYGYHFVELPDDYAGKTLQINMYVTERDAFTSLNTPYICNGNNVIRDFVITNTIPLAVILFLITFGICILLVSFMFVVKNTQFLKLICVGLFSIGIGFWSLCNYDLIILFTYDLRIKAYIEYTSLFLCALPVCMYFKDDVVDRNKIVKGMFYFAMTVLVIFIVVAVTLQVTNIVHYPAILKIYHLILFLIFGILIGVAIYDVVRHKISNPALMIGMVIMIAMGIMDMIRYNIQKYIPTLKASHYVSQLCLGALIFVLAQLIDFGLEITNALYKSVQKETLEKMAYTDALTGIYNRRKCEEEWDSLDIVRNYGIIAFDLNNLKKMNDSKGHEMGDVMIKSFAGVLQEVFGEIGVVCRTGGDEFVVILPNVARINIDSLMEKFHKSMEQVNEKNKGLDLSAAYGYCGSKENPGCDAREIYRMADARMYENKIAMKCARI